MQRFLTNNYRFLFAILLTVLILLSFYVGTLYGTKGGSGGVTLMCDDTVLSALKIPTTTPSVAQQSAIPVTTSSGAFLGSKTGTKYYTPDCAGAKRIKPENVIWFQDAESATLQGYTPATC